jgi:hypothetical protein
MLAPSAPNGAAPWTRRRARGVDRRTRAARRWAALRANYAASLGREARPDEQELLDACADVALQREILRARLTAGERIDPAVVTGLASEGRRLRRALGLEGPGEASLEELLGGLK